MFWGQNPKNPDALVALVRNKPAPGLHKEWRCPPACAGQARENVVQSEEWGAEEEGEAEENPAKDHPEAEQDIAGRMVDE